MLIIVKIEPDADVFRCGECMERFYVGRQQCWRLNGEWYRIRGPECLAAEKVLRDLVEAGEDLSLVEPRFVEEKTGQLAAWYSAIAALKKLEER